METLLAVLLVLASPGLFAASLLFPFFWIGQHRLLRRTGSWALQREFQKSWFGRLAYVGLSAMGICLLAFLREDLLPTVAAFLGSGGFLLAGLPFLLDIALVMLYSPDEAVQKWKAEQAGR
jgi:hypothetical protein